MMEGAGIRHCRLRFGRAPDRALRARFESAVAAASPAPVLHWEGDVVHVEYSFPDCGFGECWRGLLAADIHRELRAPDRMRGALRALLEHNEREFLRRPGGWRRHLDRLYLACAPDPVAPVARGKRLWRKHERAG